LCRHVAHGAFDNFGRTKKQETEQPEAMEQSA
jgi:hypothetical protein